MRRIVIIGYVAVQFIAEGQGIGKVSVCFRTVIYLYTVQIPGFIAGLEGIGGIVGCLFVRVGVFPHRVGRLVVVCFFVVMKQGFLAVNIRYF
ncbi:hypothetical protein Barb4_02170 [Bacteroidales bacterium Barb4]|nr:hypothetical protein Barb4_02170 [Bacteroidales bacterium Barb4]